MREKERRELKHGWILPVTMITCSVMIQYVHLTISCNTVLFLSLFPSNGNHYTSLSPFTLSFPISLIQSAVSFLSSCASFTAQSHFISLWHVWNCNQYSGCTQLRDSNHLYPLASDSRKDTVCVAEWMLGQAQLVLIHIYGAPMPSLCSCLHCR